MQLPVTSLIPIQSQPQPGWGVWPDVCNDERVLYMEQLIGHQIFHKHMWHGGDTSQPLFSISPLVVPPVIPKKCLKAKPTSCKATQPSHSARKVSKSRNQRRISNYFPRAVSARDDKVMELLSEVLGIVSSLQKESKQTSKQQVRRKKHSTTKTSAFHTLIGRTKKGQQSHRGIQTEAEAQDQTSDKGCQTDFLDATSPKKTDQLIKSPVVSQYRVHFYGSTSTTSPTNDIAPVTSHIGPQHPAHSPVHTSPSHIPSSIHKDSPIHPNPTSPPNTNHHLSPVHNTPLHTPIHPSPTSPPNMRTRSVIYDSSAHPNSPPTHHILSHGLEIFDPISPDPPSIGQPKYDTSTNQASQCQLPFTPDTSPNKSEGSLSGFIGHARTLNAFSATATSKALVTNIQVNTHFTDSDIVELSEGSPDRPRSRHVPSREENQLAHELNRVNTIPAVDLITPLPQIQWDIFQRIIANKKDVFHITPSHFEFTNNFLLQLAQPKHWTSAYVRLSFTTTQLLVLVSDPS
ncbi:unnamed protein product [Eruca vesicaria subsp. sativa]|uniref:Uncharacterized protein n=1 Tax=Eruca vesicaria subsp. sativa TaxID=29727 RepID=A0ABC8K229_ERUVS|nr:unnamed protein product [Eruca vesicaria subsp. sativa]